MVYKFLGVKVMSKQEKLALEVIEKSMNLPFVKVNRDEFLIRTFQGSKHSAAEILEKGPLDLFSKSELDKKASKVINSNVLKSSSASFAAGIPGGFAMAATIPADLVQFYGFTLKLAQEISYIYGYDSLFDENEELTDEAHDTLILYLGIMFGVTAAGSSIRIASQKASQQALKSIPGKALTKTFYYPILKKVLKVFGVKLTKDSFSKAVSKTIPFVGGAVSGGLNYASMKPMARRLRDELRKDRDDYSKEDYENDLKILNITEDDLIIE